MSRNLHDISFQHSCKYILQNYFNDILNSNLLWRSAIFKGDSFVKMPLAIF